MKDFLGNPFIYAWSGNITAYDYFTSFVYSMTGYSPLSLFFISSLAGSITALFVYFIAKELFSRNVARLSCIFALFWPSFIFWSTQHLKEPMIAMFVCIFLWTIFYIYRTFCAGFLSLSIISLWVLFEIGRVYLVIIISVILFLGLFLFIKHLFKNRFVTLLIIGILFIIMATLFSNMIFSSAIMKGSYNIEGYKSVFDFFNYHRSVRTIGNLRFLGNFDISSLGRSIVFLPFGLFFAFFAPFPWQLGSVNQIIAVPETILFYILIPFTLKGVVFAYKKRFNQSILLLSIIGGIITVLALVEGNTGTLFRHRSIPFYFLFIFTSVGIVLKKRLK